MTTLLERSFSFVDRNFPRSEQDEVRTGMMLGGSLGGSLEISGSETDSSLGSSSLDSSCFSSGEVLMDEGDDAIEEPSFPAAASCSSSSNRVSFSETVKVREIIQDEDSDKEEQVDSVTTLKNPDYSKPSIFPIQLNPKEQALRSMLVGCLPAQKRTRHDFAKMYGCGKSVRSLDEYDDSDLDDDDDEAILNSEPVRVIQASAPSSFWFSPI